MKHALRRPGHDARENSPPDTDKHHNTPFRRRDPTHQDIERRAYELYRQRNGDNGSELLDWLEAERELRAAAEQRAFARDLDA